VAAAVRAAFEVRTVLVMAAETVGFTLSMIFLVRPLLRIWARHVLPRDGELSVNALAVLLAAVFGCAIVTNLIGIFAVFGAFVLGAILSGEPGLRAAVHRRLSDFVTAFFVPVFFAYNGFQTASFMTGELRDPRRMLSRGLLIGITAVVVLYVCVNAICLHALGEQGLAGTNTPASDVARLAFGPIGARIMAAVVALSTLGYLGNQILTAPRVYLQMANDGLFFKAFAQISRRTRVPVVAIAAQGIAAMVIALSGKYETILNWVTSVDYIFFGFAAIALFSFRAKDARDPNAPKAAFVFPGHPYTTLIFLIVSWGLVLDVAIKATGDTAVGLIILLTGVPAYLIFARWRGKRAIPPLTTAASQPSAD